MVSTSTHSQRAQSPLPLDSRSLLVLYATVTGTAEDVAQRIARRGRRHGWSVAVKSVSEFDSATLIETPLIVFVLPTTGNGAAPPSLIPLWTSLLHPSLPPDILEDLRYAVFGLGDSSYGKYNWVAKKMTRRLDALGALAVIPSGEGDDQNEWGIESTFPAWLDSLYQTIDPLFPTVPGYVPPPSEAIPAARIILKPSPDGCEPAPAPKWAPDVRWAKLRKNKRVTPEKWFQDVREIEVEVDGSSHVAGDVLEIRPQNGEKDVGEFLSSVGWTEVADMVYDIFPSSPDQPLPPHLPTPYRTTLRHLLTNELDIACVPRVSFFEWLAAFSEGDMAEKLRWFCTGEGQDDLIDYTLRPRRTILEVMYEFRAAKIPPEYILDLLPPLRVRGFSIASSSKVQPDVVDLLVAIVKYKSSLSIPRKGVCTTYLSSLKPGDSIPIRFERGMLTLPEATAEPPPLIMIGPGTGVAPFRALLQERIKSGASENMLFFGCRSVESDYYYRDEWEKLEKEGKLVLNIAPSRDQEDKLYVQHLIPKHAPLIWDYLQRGGYVYICGSSTNMPKAVKKAILQVVREQGAVAEGDDERLWESWERNGRVIEETWG